MASRRTGDLRALCAGSQNDAAAASNHMQRQGIRGEVREGRWERDGRAAHRSLAPLLSEREEESGGRCQRSGMGCLLISPK